MPEPEEGGATKTLNQQLLDAADKSVEEVKELLAKGADVDYGDKFGETALMNACRGGHNEIVHYLVHNANANINLQFKDKSGWTALMFAAYFGHLDLVEHLVACGAKLDLVNKKQQTVSDLEPCMHATREQSLAAIERGLASLNNPINILTEKKDDKLVEDGDEQGKEMLKRAEQYRKISATASTGEALTQFSDLYAQTCEDFQQKPVANISRIISDFITGELELDTFPLTGMNLQGSEKLVDSQVFPLFEVLGHGFPNAPFTTMDLSWNAIRNSGSKAIAVYLTQTKTLTKLDLSGNKIEQLGVQKLASSLLGQTTLKVLKLAQNPVGEDGMVEMAEALLSNTTLEEVDFAHTDLGTRTLMKLASVLNSDSSPLVSLDVSSPLLYSREEETTIALAKAIKVNSTLQRLSMRSHGITDHGAMWISDHLAQNNTITHLDLGCNSLTYEGVAMLAHALSKRLVACEVPLDGCPLCGRDRDEIDDAIEEISAANTPMVVTYDDDYHSHRLTATPRY